MPERVTLAMNGGFKLLNNFCILGNAVTKAVAISSPVRLPDVNTKTATPAFARRASATFLFPSARSRKNAGGSSSFELEL